MTDRQVRRARRNIRRMMRRGSRLGTTYPVVSCFEVLQAIEAAEDDLLPSVEGVERIEPWDATLIGGVPTEYVMSLAVGAKDDRRALAIVSEALGGYLDVDLNNLTAERGVLNALARAGASLVTADGFSQYQVSQEDEWSRWRREHGI